MHHSDILHHHYIYLFIFLFCILSFPYADNFIIIYIFDPCSSVLDLALI